MNYDYKYFYGTRPCSSIKNEFVPDYDQRKFIAEIFVAGSTIHEATKREDEFKVILKEWISTLSENLEKEILDYFEECKKSGSHK